VNDGGSGTLSANRCTPASSPDETVLRRGNEEFLPFL
jgi:hypothetical protein